MYILLDCIRQSGFCEGHWHGVWNSKVCNSGNKKRTNAKSEGIYISSEYPSNNWRKMKEKNILEGDIVKSCEMKESQK